MEEEAEILIEGSLVVPVNGRGLVHNGTIAVKNGTITYMGRSSQASKIKAEKKIDAKGKVALPGLINCHTHIPMTLFRGMAEDQPLDKWLKETIWPSEAKLKPEDVYTGALLGCQEMIESGTTCFADIYFHENMVAKAVKESGLRGVLAEGIIEAGNKERGEKMLQNSVVFIEKHHGQADGRVTTMLGPHAAYSCSPNLLSQIGEIAAELEVGVHTHMAESEKMSKKLREEYGLSEVDFLDKAGVLEADVLAAHCINLARKDMQTLSERKVNVAYVPVSNMKFGLGTARICELINLGMNVALGTDGPASNNTLDMFETMKVAALLQKNLYLDPKILTAKEVLEMATIKGAEALGLSKEIGSLEVGKRADIILVDISKTHTVPLHNIFATIIYSARGSDVDTVIVDGKIVMEDRIMVTIDKEAVIKHAEETACALVSR